MDKNDEVYKINIRRILDAAIDFYQREHPISPSNVSLRVIVPIIGNTKMKNVFNIHIPLTKSLYIDKIDEDIWFVKHYTKSYCLSNTIFNIELLGDFYDYNTSDKDKNEYLKEYNSNIERVKCSNNKRYGFMIYYKEIEDFGNGDYCKKQIQK